jgi:phosphohistidine phosphatase SixA
MLPRLAAMLLAAVAVEGAEANEALWAKLREGGHAVLIRHAATEPGLGDPPNFRLGDCSTQRNLSAAGRDDARRLGAAFRERKVPVAGVLSSGWCRCQDTARLAFGEYEVWAPLNSFFSNGDREGAQTRALAERLGDIPARSNLVLVTHQVNITAATGVFPAPGDLVVVRSGGGGKLEVVGRMSAPR